MTRRRAWGRRRSSSAAGVHVLRILAKPGVAGRGETAAIADRLGFDKQ
jgi:hypothetical protein